MSFRTEHDSLGAVQVPESALYGAQTQRAIENFPISGRGMPQAFLKALALIKLSAARINIRDGRLDVRRGDAIVLAAREVLSGAHADQFPVDVFQTGSGTSTNMNMNEVLARLASAGSGVPVHPNDHVNMCQSSNDVIPSALQLSACLETMDGLLPSLLHLRAAISARGAEFADVVKTGRTHLMDAMPLRVEQEFGAWAEQIADVISGIEATLPLLRRLPIGATAVGTGINAPSDFGEAVAAELSAELSHRFESPAGFRNLGSQDNAVAFSGALNVAATALMKICNDLRWMNSGPLAGLGELRLPALQPGSSIMPGKVNPVIPEAVAMVCVQVSALHHGVTSAGQSGNFQLNVMLPLIADNLLQSITLLGNGSRVLADKAIAGLHFDRQRLESTLLRNPVLVTALNSRIGYAAGAAIARAAYEEGRAVIDVAEERTALSREELIRLLDPMRLTQGGIPED